MKKAEIKEEEQQEKAATGESCKIGPKFPREKKNPLRPDATFNASRTVRIAGAEYILPFNVYYVSLSMHSFVMHDEEIQHSWYITSAHYTCK